MDKSLQKLELHDARIKNFNIDYISKTGVLMLDYYETSESKNRIPGKIVFEDIEFISQINDFVKLSEHHSAGNINYWVPHEKSLNTYIYLSDGCIVVKAKNIKIE